MIHLLLAETPAPTDGGNLWVVALVFLIPLIGLYLFNSNRRKKYEESMQELTSKLKVGDKIKTYAGIYGVIVEIEEKDNVKTAIVQTGSDKHPGYFSIDVGAMYPINQDLEVVVTDEVLPDSNEVHEQLVEANEKPKTKPKKAKETKETKTETESK